MSQVPSFGEERFALDNVVAFMGREPPRFTCQDQCHRLLPRRPGPGFYPLSRLGVGGRCTGWTEGTLTPGTKLSREKEGKKIEKKE